MNRLVMTSIFFVALAAAAMAQSGGDFELIRSTINGGGGKSSGDDFEIDGTIGQAVVDSMGGGDFAFSSGFWAGGAGGGGGCATNLDCDDADPCTVDLCDVDACEFPPRLYGDANNDGVRNVVDVVCSARVTFQDATSCGEFEVSLDEIDIAPSAACGDDQLNITDVVAHALAAFQDAVDECCTE